jgi:hypothetical protein
MAQLTQLLAEMIFPTGAVRLGGTPERHGGRTPRANPSLSPRPNQVQRLQLQFSGLATIRELRDRDVVLRSLRERIDSSNATGRMVAGVLASLAELELELGRERRA